MPVALPEKIAADVLHLVRKPFSYRGLLGGLYTATFCIRASFGIAVVLLSAYLTQHAALFGLVVSITPLAELIAVPFVGIANDRYGRRAMLLSGLGVAAVSLAGRALTVDLVPQLLFNVLHGVAAALILVTSLALLADWASKETRGREMGIFDFVSLFGWMIGFILGLILADVFADRLAVGFLVAALIAIAGLLFAHRTVHEPEGRADAAHPGLADLGRIAARPQVALVLGPWLLMFILIGGTTTFLERFATKAGFTGTQAALGLGVLTVVLLASQVWYGKLSDRFGRSPLIVLGAWGFFAFTSAAAFLVLDLGVTIDEDELVAAMPLFGPFLALSFLAMLAFGPAALAALADQAQKGRTGVTMSLYSLVVGLGFIIGPTVTGLVTQYGGPTGRAIALFTAGGLFVGLVVLRNHIERAFGVQEGGDRELGAPWELP